MSRCVALGTCPSPLCNVASGRHADRHVSDLQRVVRALVYLMQDAARVRAWAQACLDYCEARAYLVVAVVVDTPDRAKWTDVEATVAAGEVDVVVFATQDHMPPRPGWMRVATGDLGGASPALRRPRRRRQ